MDAASMSQLQKQLILHAGCRLAAYRGWGGVLTIARGRNLRHRGLSRRAA